MFCQTSGYGGTVQEGHDSDKVSEMKADPSRIIKIKFAADTAAAMRWNFRPQQAEIKVHPGETALAFYTAKNPTSKPIDGIFATFDIQPIQCGYESFDRGVQADRADHRCLWADLDLEQVFGHVLPPLQRPPSRRLKLQDAQASRSQKFIS